MSLERGLSIVLQEASTLERAFAHKIRTLEEIKAIIGDLPRGKKVIMCHGTFNIVHPGHLRQLVWASTKGSVLITSVTCDQHVKKESKYVPERLRALNLAAYQMVDFVIIDQNPTPIENILYLQPDFFVKGFEYSQGGIHPRTREEMQALSSYGGELIFSPGDIIYSSTEILSQEKPNLALDRLREIMRAHNLTFGNLRETVDNFRNFKVDVVGDLIIDKYSQGVVQGQAQKAPAFSFRIDKTEMFTGGAGIVAQHLISLGAKVSFCTVRGEDEAGALAKRVLQEGGIRIHDFVDPSRPTTVKHRYLQDGQLIFQANTVDNATIPARILAEICEQLASSRPDAVVCSDYRHGIFNRGTIPVITKAIPQNTFTVADSQVSNRWGNILEFQGFDLITPNEREARHSLGDQDSGPRPLAQELYRKASCRNLILKLGRDGLMAYQGPSNEIIDYFTLDSLAQEVADPIGAGDALLAASTLAMLASKDILRAAILGNLSAAIECATVGNTPVTAKQLRLAINKLEERISQL